MLQKHQNIIDYVGSESLVYEFQQNQASAHLLQNINLAICSNSKKLKIHQFDNHFPNNGHTLRVYGVNGIIGQQSCIKQGVWRKTTYLEASEGVSNPNSIEYIQIPQKYQYLVYLLVSHKLYRGYKGKSEV
ncbi:hypothetical protein ABPG74_007101 [Tetrahymena malaccensis]